MSKNLSKEYGKYLNEYILKYGDEQESLGEEPFKLEQLKIMNDPEVVMIALESEQMLELLIQSKSIPKVDQHLSTSLANI